ncbi:MAG: hypothetical protein ACW99Q_14960, partial [Candidatus Kariarchaeaceae archaeon]
MRPFYNSDQDISSIRFYKDVFPNELSEVYNLEENTQLATNDQNDTDPTNDIIVASPDLEQLLSLNHARDGISAIYDQQAVYENGEVQQFNILAKEKSILVPGGFNAVTNFNSETNQENITLSVIESKPKDGVLYDLNTRFGPRELEGGTNYYYDLENNGEYSAIFVADPDDNVINIGFDYDSDNILNPGKLQRVEKHILYYEPSGWKKDDAYVAESYKDFSLVYIQDYDHYDGVFYEYQFGDAMFDVWKMQYSEGSSKLIEEQMSITSNQFIQSITPSKIKEDIGWQIKAQIGAAVVGGILSAIVGAITGGTGADTAFKLGYMITYALENAIHGWIEARDQQYYINSQTFHNENYDGQITLSDRTKMDEYYGDVMTQSLIGSRSATYSTVKIETDKHLYQGQLVLAPGDLDKTNYFKNLDITFKHLILDYPLQSRNYLMYSDFDDSRLEAFYFEPYEGFIMDVDPQLKYMEHSLMYLEDEVNKAAKNNDDTQLNRVVPYIAYGRGTFVPILEFADSENDDAVIPDFYIDYPIFVSSDQYDSVKSQYYSIFKVYDLNTETIQMLPESSVHTLNAKILSYDATVLDTLGNEIYLGRFGSGIAFGESNGFTFDKDTSVLDFEPSLDAFFNGKITDQKTAHAGVQDYDAYIVFEFHIEKYRDITNLGDLSTEEVNRIATAQSAHASILEYLYQHTIATETQNKLSEIAYTLIVTAASTALTAGVTKVWTIVSEMAQEVFLDPWIEAWAINFAEDLGADTFGQLLFSGFAEGFREAFFGGVSSTLKTSIGINTNTKTSQDLDTSNQNTLQKIHSKVRSIKQSISDSKVMKGLSVVISSVAMFSGISIGGMGLMLTTLGFKIISDFNAKMLKNLNIRSMVDKEIQRKERQKKDPTISDPKKASLSKEQKTVDKEIYSVDTTRKNSPLSLEKRIKKNKYTVNPSDTEDAKLLKKILNTIFMNERAILRYLRENERFDELLDTLNERIDDEITAKLFGLYEGSEI